MANVSNERSLYSQSLVDSEATPFLLNDGATYV
jgi:hypothetical protein